MFEWGTIVFSTIASLLSAGGIGWIVTAKEDKRAKKLENKQKEAEIEEYKKDEIITDWKDIAEERKRAYEEQKLKNAELEARLIERDAQMSELRNKLDERNTYCAVSELLKCTDLQCTSRKPPFASTIVTSEKAIESYIKNIQES